MPNSLYTGVTGLRAHQEMLDVVGNNLANTNTTAYKAQRILFSDLVYQTITPGGNGGANVGGVNPQQIGLGVKVSAIDANLGQGSLDSTQNTFDLALQGQGYFVANDGTQDYFTRAGVFGVDNKNNLVDPSNGFRVQRFGGVGEGSATLPAFQTSGDNNIKIPFGTAIPGRATTEIMVDGNLSANATGPAAQALTSSQPFLSAGLAATAATLLNSLDDNSVDYIAGDQLRFQGVTHGGTSVNTTLALSGATTVGDLIATINANFPGSTASLDANGNLLVTANSTGTSTLDVIISDGVGNTGFTSWGNHTAAVTTYGKDGDKVTTGIAFYDPQGTSHLISMEFQKQGNNTWSMRASIPGRDGTLTDNQIDGITFNDDGSFRFVSGTGVGDTYLTAQLNGFSVPQTIRLNLGDPGSFAGLTQVGGNSSAVAKEQDGFSAGFLSNVEVAQDGVINGIFTNGRILPIAQIAVASFRNPAALLRQGDNYYSLSSESGTALIGSGLTGGRGGILQKTLEASNVDVALEFTRLIIAQRGFQVNARTITASNEVLQELANIIR